MFTSLPLSAGVGFKPQHLQNILASTLATDFWFEFHAENYMRDGGPAHTQLRAIAERHAISCHGVGMSIGSDLPLDKDHLQRLKKICDNFQPQQVSEHLAWSSTFNHSKNQRLFLNDLLPIDYSEDRLKIVAIHVMQVQDHLGQAILIENPSRYLQLGLVEDYSEIDFLRELAQITGCGLLLDINNVYVCAVNLGFDAQAYLKQFPYHFVKEIHLAGHAREHDERLGDLLIDAHQTVVNEQVWRLYRFALSMANTKIPTLIEWDNHIPAWPTLYAQAQLAKHYLEEITTNTLHSTLAA